MTKEERDSIYQNIKLAKEYKLPYNHFGTASRDVILLLRDLEAAEAEIAKLSALCQNGESAIDTNKRLVDEIIELVEMRDRYKALAKAETARADEADKKNRQWNDQDCNKCPNQGVSVGDSGSDKICLSKATFTNYFNEVISERDKWKTRAEELEIRTEALETAIKTTNQFGEMINRKDFACLICANFVQTDKDFYDCKRSVYCIDEDENHKLWRFDEKKLL